MLIPHKKTVANKVNLLKSYIELLPGKTGLKCVKQNLLGLKLTIFNEVFADTLVTTQLENFFVTFKCKFFEKRARPEDSEQRNGESKTASV